MGIFSWFLVLSFNTFPKKKKMKKKKKKDVASVL